MNEYISYLISTCNKDGLELRADVLGDPQGMPGVDRAVGKHYSGAAYVIASVDLVGLSHGLCQSLCTHIVELGTLFYVVSEEVRGGFETGHHTCSDHREPVFSSNI